MSRGFALLASPIPRRWLPLLCRAFETSSSARPSGCEAHAPRFLAISTLGGRVSASKQVPIRGREGRKTRSDEPHATPHVPGFLFELRFDACRLLGPD